MSNALLLATVALAMPACALDDAGDRGDPGVTATYPGDPPPSNGNCPRGETCSSQTPNGLAFVGAQPVFLMYPNGIITNINHQLAVGGHDIIDLQQAGTDFTLPFTTAASSASTLGIDSTDGAKVTIHSIQAGTSYLRVLDPQNQLYDRENYAASQLSQLLAVPVSEQFTAPSQGASATSYVFATGDRTVGIALLDSGTTQHRLIDTSLVLALPGATQTRWDSIRIPNAQVGHYAVSVSVGGTAVPRMVDVEIVDKADGISAVLAKGGVACFAASAHGAFVAGLSWKFTINGFDIPADNDIGGNCVADIFANPTFTVTASAGGQTLTVTTTP